MMFIAGCAASALGQNSIDRLVEDCSSVGRSKFTSAVERDPNTRKIQKVVKVLELSDADAGSFSAAFKREKGTGDFIEKRTENGITMVLTVRGKGQNRVYALRCDGPCSSRKAGTRYRLVKVTVIVSYGS
mgnify:FL=1